MFHLKQVRLALAIASILALTLTSAALAQRGQGVIGSGGMGGRMGGRMYDPQTVTTVSGEVVSADTVSGPRGRYQGLHLTLKTATETIAVHLGPSWYFDQQKITFAPKDTIEITGSRVTLEGKPVIIAAQVKKGGQTLKLRDANGIPVWAGQGRRQ
jgi:hypothetical protein